MSKLNTEAGIIEGVGFYYTKIQQATPKFNPEDGNEYVVDIHVDEETADAWDEEFKKNKSKFIKYDEFVEKFGAENAIGKGKQYFIKLKKNESYADKTTGEKKAIPDIYRPRVLLDVGNGELEDITLTKLVSNGSKGVVQYEVNENKYGRFANLVAIKVEDFIEYKSKSSGAEPKFEALGKIKKTETPVVSETVKTVDADSEW